MTVINEDTVEQLAMGCLADLGYATAYGGQLAPGQEGAEREGLGDVVLVGRLRAAVQRLNPELPAAAREEAVQKVLRLDSPVLTTANRRLHGYLTSGVPVEYKREDGSIAGELARLIDFEPADPADNDFLAVNQFIVTENGHNRRPDVVVFVNGLPLAVLELKSAVHEEADIWQAWRQLQTYKAEIPSLFEYNALLVISDGITARIGSLTAGTEWFKPWKTIAGETPAANHLELETLLRGAFEKQRLLHFLRGFVTFEADTGSDRVYKIIAGYHQFHAVQRAVQATVEATSESGDRRCGVVWHTQGSGKSFSMLFYAGEIIRHPAMNNPTLVVLTDRNDLDDQLFGQFQRCRELLRQEPVQARSVPDLREKLKVASGGVVFTTIQKFAADRGAGKFPLLSDRSNIVVIADEAHRSQYDLVDGLAANLRDGLPAASFIGFTGTPIETNDANTRAVFGDYVSIYDIQRAVQDNATVPIYYESRVARLSLREEKLPQLDEKIEELTEGEEEDSRQKQKSKWAALEVLVGDPERLAKIAADLVKHYEGRTTALAGKAMIVCMSRRICVNLYNEIAKLRPDWHHAEDSRGAMKIMMTGSAADGPDWQQHIRTKAQRKELARRFKEPADPFRIVIVRDMWLTGFDAPCMHTMYVDKPMRGHGLMQAIARVNRVFKDKPGGLVVDYIGLADQLKQALAVYTASGGQGQTMVDTEEAIAVLQEKHAVCCDMLHGFDWSGWESMSGAARLSFLPAAANFVLNIEDGRTRFPAAVTELSQAFALCAASDEATALRGDIAFFQAVRTSIRKLISTGGGSRSSGDVDSAVRQLVSEAVGAPGEVIDVFSAAGLKRPDISILSDEFLEEVRGVEHKNVAAELLRKLLQDELRTHSQTNVVQARKFSEMLQTTVNRYHNRAIATQEIIDELIVIAKNVRTAQQRGEEMGLGNDELAFYDALAMNDSAVEAMGSDELKVIAAALVTQVRKSVTIDWTHRESARAKIRVMVRRILRKFGYPPDLQEAATKVVLEQAEALCQGWAEG